MEQIRNKEYGGERPLFATHDLQLEDVTIHAGESALKECSNIIAINCRFEGKISFFGIPTDFIVKKLVSFTEGSPCCSMVLSKSANGRYLGRSTEDVP